MLQDIKKYTSTRHKSNILSREVNLQMKKSGRTSENQVCHANYFYFFCDAEMGINVKEMCGHVTL